MKKLILFELRKVFSKRLSLIVLVGILLFSVLISFSTYQNKYAFDGVSAEGSGKTAVAAAICFAELFLHRFEFILSCLSHAVDTGYETLHRFLTVCNIVQDTAQTA